MIGLIIFGMIILCGVLFYGTLTLHSKVDDDDRLTFTQQFNLSITVLFIGLPSSVFIPIILGLYLSTKIQGG